jgi:tRNA-binding EMAP/Myf-like protein
MALAKVKPAISPELLDQIDVRVGTIESVNDVAKSDKLVALRVRESSASPDGGNDVGSHAV